MMTGWLDDAERAEDGWQEKGCSKVEVATSLSSFLIFFTRTSHHRGWLLCIMPGEIDEGGLETRMPVLGLTMGMAFRVRTAEGWWIFI
jgi:hypothetical protein